MMTEEGRNRRGERKRRLTTMLGRTPPRSARLSGFFRCCPGNSLQISPPSSLPRRMAIVVEMVVAGDGSIQDPSPDV